jgi:hypothetical protein
VTLEAPPQPPSPVPEASETAELNSADATHAGLPAGGTTYNSRSAANPSAAGALGGGSAAGGRAEPTTVDEYRAENRKLREQLAQQRDDGQGGRPRWWGQHRRERGLDPAAPAACGHRCIHSGRVPAVRRAGAGGKPCSAPLPGWLVVVVLSCGWGGAPGSAASAAPPNQPLRCPSAAAPQSLMSANSCCC